MEKENENDIERYLRWQCKRHGWLCLKMRPYENGYPDRIVVLPHGLTAWVELKSTGCKPRKLQFKRMDSLIEMGHIVAWADSRSIIDYLVSDLEEMCKGRETGDSMDSVS